MKKSIIILILILCCSIVSCGQNNNGNMITESCYYNMPCADSDHYIKSLGEYGLWTYEKIDMHENHKAPESVTVSFDGNKYSGKYSYSSVEYYNTYESDFYDFDGGWFSVKTGTDELDSIAFYGANSGSKSVDDCLLIAKSIAEHYINIDEYDLTVKQKDDYCYFVYVRTINGVETCDRLSLIISTSGEIVSFNMWMCSEMKEILNAQNQRSPSWEENKVAELVDEKYEDALFEKIIKSNNDIKNLKVLDVTVVALENGDFGLVYNIEGEIITKDAENDGEDIEPIMMSFLAFNKEI